MTAIAAIASGARGRMMVDSAAYAADGVMVGHIAKAVPLPHLGAVFATRGATAARWAIADELERFDGFDAIVTGAAATLREAHEDGAFGEAVDLTLVGWSADRRRVELYSLSTLSYGELAPFVLHQMAVSLAPLPDDEALRRIGLKVGAMFDLSRPAEKLLEVVEVQRRTLAPLGTSPDAPAGYGIGGAVVLTEVAEAGITQRVVRRWPDVIGNRLVPDGCPPPASPSAHLRIVA